LIEAHTNGDTDGQAHTYAYAHGTGEEAEEHPEAEAKGDTQSEVEASWGSALGDMLFRDILHDFLYPFYGVEKTDQGCS